MNYNMKLENFLDL